MATTTQSWNRLDNEGFETATTGYERSGWANAVGSPDPYYDTSGLTTNKPNYADNRAFRSNYSSGGSFHAAMWDSGSARSETCYFRFYLYVVSHGFVSASDTNPVFTVSNSGTNYTDGYRCAQVRLAYVGSTLGLVGYGTAASTQVNISTGQWYLVELKVVPNGASAMKVNGGAEQTFTASGYTSWRGIAIGTTASSNQNYTYNDSIIDLVAADTNGYLGATPAAGPAMPVFAHYYRQQ